MLSFLWIHEESHGVLYLDSSQHVAFLIVTACLFIMYCLKAMVEIIKEPKSWILFFVYCVIITTLNAYQTYVPIAIRSEDVSSFTKPSAPLLNASFSFCVLQAVVNFVYQLIMGAKTPKVGGVKKDGLMNPV